MEISHADELAVVTLSEIASQPEVWRRVSRLAANSVPGMPRSGERVMVLGCGTSYYMASAYAWMREQGGHGRTEAAIASEWPEVVREYDRVMVISRSGTSMETVQAVERVAPGIPITGILGDLATPLGRAVTDIVDLSFVDEASVVQTRFPTTVLTLMRAHLGATIADLDGLADSAQRAIVAGPTESAPGQIVILGTGWSVDIAEEAALKCRESAGMWAEAYAVGEYRHGPIGAAGPQTLVWSMVDLTPVQVESIVATGARLRIGRDDPQVELVKLQMHAAEWARHVGRNPDMPPNLSRSVVAL